MLTLVGSLPGRARCCVTSWTLLPDVMDRYKRLLSHLWGATTALESQARRLTRLCLGSLLGLLCLVLVLRTFRWEQFKHDLASLELPWILAALCAFAVEYTCRIERWRKMLQHENATARWIDCAGPLLASYAANSVLPFRAGDILRTFGFEQILGASAGVVVATLVVERLLDMVVLIAALCFVFVHFGIGVFGNRAVGMFLLTTAALLSLLLLVFPKLLEPICLRLSRLLRLLAPKMAERLIPEIQKGLHAFSTITGRQQVLYLLALSIVAWICEGYIFWFAARALPSLTFPSASWIALPLGALSTLIPSAPGYVGTFEYTVVQAMTMTGNTSSAATTYSFLVHGLLSLPSILAGGLYLFLHFTRHSTVIADP